MDAVAIGERSCTADSSNADLNGNTLEPSQLVPSGKEDHHRAVGDRVPNTIHDFRSRKPPLAIDKDCTRSMRQPAEQRPSCDIELRYKDAGPNRAQDDDIEITQVIAD